MKTLIITFLLVGMGQLTMATPPSEISFCRQLDDRDGSSYEKAIIIDDTTTQEGIASEYKWLRKKYPGYKFLKQALSPYKNKYYDVLFIRYKGKKIAVYFDISNFFGKF